jgi:hypothetical protein
MTLFRNPLVRRAFVKSMCWRLALLLAITVGFPFLTYGIVVATGANQDGGAGGAVAAVVGLTLKPLLYVVFCALLLRPTARRAFNLGMSLWIGLALMLLALADFGFGLVFGVHWGALFAAGVMSVSPPYFLAAVFVAVLTLAILRNGDGQLARDRLGLAYRCWTILLAFMAFHAFLLVLLGASFFAASVGANWAVALSMPLLKALMLLQAMSPQRVMLVLFALVSLWLIINDRRGARTGPNLGPTPLATT